MRAVRRLLLLILPAALLAACAPQEKSANARPGVSTIPWNRPAKWEGPGVYGSALSGMQ